MSHISVLLNETIDALLAGRTEGIYIDATFGRGGHTQALLKRLSANSRVIAFDKDPQAQAVGAAMVGQDSRLTMVHASFADLAEQLEQLNTGLVDGVMADLGVSSPQLDQAGRGFSFMQDGPLDMRMDNSKGLTASQCIFGFIQGQDQALPGTVYALNQVIQAGQARNTTANNCHMFKICHDVFLF